MPEIQTLIALFLCGCVGGFLAGLLGVGGGIIFIPVLTYYLKSIGITDPDLTKAFLANSFFAIIFSGISGSWKQYQMGQFFPRQVLITAAGAILASLLVSYLISLGSWYNKERFTIFFISVLIFLNIRLFIHRKKEGQVQIQSYGIDKFIITGVIAGAFAALSGLGGGFIMVMLFVQWLSIDIKQATAVSTGTIPFIAIPLVVFYALQRPLNFPDNVLHFGFILVYAMIPMILGVILFSPVGVIAASKMKTQTIKMVFIIFSSVVISKMIYELF